MNEFNFEERKKELKKETILTEEDKEDCKLF